MDEIKKAVVLLFAAFSPWILAKYRHFTVAKGWELADKYGKYLRKNKSKKQ